LRRPKTQALQRVAKVMKNKRITVANTKINSTKDIMALVDDPASTIVIDAFDNAESRNLFLDLPNGYNVMHIGFSAALTGEFVWNETFSKMEKEDSDDAIDVCEMAIARPFIFGLTANAAIALAKFIEKGKKINAYFDNKLILKTLEN